jgi:hypothetical protein
LGICPAKAYEMAHRYEETGCEGLPVIRLDKLYRVPRWAFAVRVLSGHVVTLAELEAHAHHVLHELTGRAGADPPPAIAAEPEAVSRPSSTGRRAAGRVRSSSRRRGAGSVEQLRLLPED